MERLDAFLKHKGYVDSREQAQNAIKSGSVSVNGTIITKVAYPCDDSDTIAIYGTPNRFVSRGGYKLEKAVEYFGLDVRGKRALDIGSSTGGFSDLLLQRGVKSVICVDTGRDQLHEKIRRSGKATVYERTDFREIDVALIRDVELIAIDVSFISTALFIEKIDSIYKQIQIVSLVKPQFECGASIAKKYRGVVADKAIHLTVLSGIIANWQEHHFFINNITYSPIAGGDGNIEYLLLISREDTAFQCRLAATIDEAFSALA